MITIRCAKTLKSSKTCFLITIVALAAAACRGGDDPEASFPLSINHAEAITQGHCLTVQTQALPTPATLGRTDALSVTIDGVELPLYPSANCSGTAQNFIAQPYPQTLSTLVELPLPLVTARVSTTLTWHSGNTTYDSTLMVSDRAKNITTGNAFACVTTESNHVQCWGDNSRAQLGTGNSSFGDYKTSPVSANLLNTAFPTRTQLSLGDYTGCAINSSQNALCWGSDFINATTVRATPVAAQGLPTGVIDLSTDAQSACAVLSNGRVYCWGQDTGLNTNGSATQIAGITNAIAVRKKNQHTCALLSTGDVECWGNNTSAQSAPHLELTTVASPTAVVLSQQAIALELGHLFSCALLETGAVECWGIIGTAAPLLTATAVGFSAEATQITAGANFVCALLENNSVECAGANTVGQLGNGTTAEAATAAPVSVQLPAGTIQTISAGGHTDQNAFACAIIDGQSFCWGSNRLGQVGIGDVRQGPFTEPLTVQGLPSQVSQVATNQSHVDGISCALHSGGRISCFGSNNAGQLGRGIEPATLARDSSPAEVQSITTATQVQVGFGYACALLQNGSVHCWGNNDGGQLGDGTTARRTSPTAVVGLAGPATQISTGNRHTCAVVQGGVQCWGWDTRGQLGNGSATDGAQSAAPVWVQGLGANSRVTAVAAGEDYTCAIVNGGAQCWGRSDLGLLGNGVVGLPRTESYPGDSSNTPVNVASLTPGSTPDALVSIDAGMNSVCALSMQGRAHCWGLLAVTSTGQYTGRPLTPVGLDNGVTQLASGGDHHCAVKNGQLLCWGVNARGQLGLNNTRDTAVPTVVPAIQASTTIYSVSTGGVGYRGYTCAATSSGTYCWGDNGEQQLGRAIPLFENLPFEVAPWQ